MLLLALMQALMQASVSRIGSAHHLQEHKSCTLRVLTYNVAGLPEGLSHLTPKTNLRQIGGLPDRYDLVLIQEDFAYPELLRQRLTLPFRTPVPVRSSRFDFGDGLSQFARLPLKPPLRARWRTCSGVGDSQFDCLTPKGLVMTKLRLAAGLWVHVYNVHLDAGSSAADRAARQSQLLQLADAVQHLSRGHAVIIGGDFNLSSSERNAFIALEVSLGARDVCATLRCREPHRVDRILVRSSSSLLLKPRSWSVDLTFHDARGRGLSDHLAVAVELSWTERYSRQCHVEQDDTVSSYGSSIGAPSIDVTSE